jgi:hypothetical protein
MTERLLEHIPLPNGLTLELYDDSRPIAGNRWLVSLAARMKVPVSPEFLPKAAPAGVSIDVLKGALGDHTVYENRKNTRYFVEAAMKDQALENLKTTFLANVLDYFSAPDFPGKLLLRKFYQTRGPTPAWFRV